MLREITNRFQVVSRNSFEVFELECSDGGLGSEGGTVGGMEMVEDG